MKVQGLLVRYLPEENMQPIFYMWDTYLGKYIYIYSHILLVELYLKNTCGTFRHVFFTCDIFTCAMDTLYECIYSGLQMIEQLFACFICGAYLYANLLTLHFQIEENHVVEIQVVLF